MRVYGAILIAAILAVAGVVYGLWWAPFVVALALGAAAPRARIAVPAGAASGLLAWLVPLAAAHVQYGLSATSNSLAAIMGFGHRGAIPIVLTLVVGTLLGLAGAWLGAAGRGLVASFARVDAIRNG
jgi:hypothetical protein